ncbi:MAG: adventurous gliding motility protein GltG [Myxococcaceae bacterium]|nr:adventurous gliding motility protein GltG [Myxococcaceae bacterium]
MGVPLTLKVFKGDQLLASKEYDRDIIKIGRLSSAHLCLDDEKVSRIHSVIEVSPDGNLSIIDMGSVEGTFVNGKRVNKGTLALGDEIKVGNTTIKVEGTQPVASVAPAIAPVGGPEAVTAQHSMPSDYASQPTAVGPMPTAAAPAAATVITPPPAPAPVAAVAKPVQDESTGQVVRGRPRRRKGAGPLGLEIRLMWGDQMVASHFIAPDSKKSFFVGSAAGVDFAMGDGRLGGPKFEAVRMENGQATVRFTSKMKGELHRTQSDQTISLKDVIEKRIASSEGEGYALTVQSDDFVWVDLGGVVMEVFFQPVPKAVLVPLSESIDFTALNIFLLMFFVGAVFVISAINRGLEGDEFDDELNGNNARIAKLIIKPPEPNKLVAALQKKKESGEMAQKHKGDDGQMGKKEAPKRSAHAAPKGDPNNKDQARMLVQKVFGGNSGGISTIFGHNGLGGELKAAMGNMFGAAPGDAAGFGGLGLRGSGSGGGGLGDSIGIGGIGTKGRGGGTGGYGSGVGVLGGKKGVDIGIDSTDPTVVGSLDKELIRQVIKRNIGQIRYCYESELTRSPKLGGKVSIKFVISASGSVAQSSVADSSMNNATVETCVAGRVRTWQFPKPKGGGVVIVTYPFVFKQSGG